MNEKSSASSLIAKWHRNYKVGRDKPNVWFFDDPSFSYIQLTKVASSSIKHALSVYAHQKYAGGRAEEVTRRMVKEYGKKYAKHGDLGSLFPEKPEFLFAFVRNPLDRLLSSYTDKVLKARKQGKEKCIFWNHDINFDMGFEQFVNRVADIPDAKIDRHLRSQHCYLCKGDELILDFIGKFESMQDDWQKLVVRLGLPELPHKNKSAKPQNEEKKTLYTKYTASKVAERYQRDIELLGYKDSVEQFIQSLDD